MPRPLTGTDVEQAPSGPEPAQLAAQGRIVPILQYPDPILRQACAPVGELDWDALRQLAADLFATMYAAQGRGLAAPQIGAPYRAFVMDAGYTDGSPDPRLFLDPQITLLSGPLGTMAETCLSLPDRPVDMPRHRDASISHFDLMGNARITLLSGVPARIAQHESDHLDGRLIIDAAR